MEAYFFLLSPFVQEEANLLGQNDNLIVVYYWWGLEPWRSWWLFVSLTFCHQDPLIWCSHCLFSNVLSCTRPHSSATALQGPSLWDSLVVGGLLFRVCPVGYMTGTQAVARSPRGYACMGVCGGVCNMTFKWWHNMCIQYTFDINILFNSWHNAIENISFDLKTQSIYSVV